MAPLSQALAIALAHHQAGRLDLAEDIYRRLLAVEPRQADALHWLGVVYHQRGRHDLAIDQISRAIGVDACQAPFHSNLGEAYRALGNDTGAEACFRRAIELKPDFALAHYNLGSLLQAQGNLAAAIDAYHLALASNPNLVKAHCNLGLAMEAQGQSDAALACYERAIVLKPDFADAYLNLGAFWQNQGQIAEALACCRKAVELRPSDARFHSNLLCTLSFSPDSGSQAIYEEARLWNQRHAASLGGFAQPHPNDRSADRRLRIGYVSPDFREHPVGRFLLPLLESHDHRRFEIFCYSSVATSDWVTDRSRASADIWRDVLRLSDEQLAEEVRRDRIDILVDLTMHMLDHRLLAFARKPAPVQVTYLAYCGTTGLDAVDYRLTDPYLDPPGESEPCYAEESIRLAETYWCYQPVIENLPVSVPPALGSGHITFGSLNNFCKVSPPVLALWTQLLRAMPKSRLLLHAHRGTHRDRARAFLAQQGVEPDRLTFVDLLPLSEYLRVYQQIDVGLDPFPYGGGTTTCDALWMGVPVVSLAGQTAVGRGGLSILSNVGLPELVARDPDDYVRIAAELASDLPRLANLRATLRQRMQDSPLMDAPRFARNVEAAYREMWRRWCNHSTEGEPAR